MAHLTIRQEIQSGLIIWLETKAANGQYSSESSSELFEELIEEIKDAEDRQEFPWDSLITKEAA